MEPEAVVVVPSSTSTTTTPPDHTAPPSHHSEPVGSLHLEAEPPSSDDDHGHGVDIDHGADHDLDGDHDHDGGDHDHDVGDHAQASGSGVLTDDLKQKIIKQVEYYFSDENLLHDKYLLGLIKKNKEGFVRIGVICSFRKMKKLTRNYSFIVTALRESTHLVVSPDWIKVKRLNPLPQNVLRDEKLYTVMVENLPEDHSMENLQKIFGGVGKVKKICLHDPNATEESKKGVKIDKLYRTKLHALVEYETVEAAEKAAATLNNDEDWRSGMRVKLLKRVGKNGQRKQAWVERGGTGHLPDQAGNEDHDSNEHHEDVATEEDGSHALREKNGERGRNHGRPRRHKHRGTNGHGHGTVTSTHGIEPSRPPPGPRMPDGTRGFTMGRGRTPTAERN